MRIGMHTAIFAGAGNNPFLTQIKSSKKEMHTMRYNKMKWFTSGAAIAAMFTGTAFAHADTNYEYQSSAGNHAQEWYDPSDWFDGEQGSDDSQTVDYEAATSGTQNSWADGEIWEDDYDHDYTSEANSHYGVNYTWNDSSNSWEREHGHYESGHGYDSASYMSSSTKSSSTNPNHRESNRNSNSEFQNRNANERRLNQHIYSRSVDYQRNHQGQMSQNMQLKQRTLSGEIDGFRHMSLQAANDQSRDYTVTKVILDNGESIVINLGEKKRLDDLKLERGDEVKVKGVIGKLNGDPIFIANTVKVEDRSFNVNRAFDALNNMERQPKQNQYERSSYSSGQMALNQDQRRQRSTWNSDDMASNQSSSSVEGTVDRFYSTSISGDDEDRTLARLRLENGKAITVDLGESRSVASLDLSQGDRVRIQGDIEHIEGRRVLKADRIWINGERASESYSYNY